MRSTVVPAIAIWAAVGVGCDAPPRPPTPSAVEVEAKAAPVEDCDASATDAAPLPQPSVPDAAPPEAPDTEVTRWTVGAYELFRENGWLHVRRGKRRAPLGIHGGNVSVEGTKATVEYMPACDDVVATFTTDQLESRLVFEHGLALARRRKHAEAAADFAKAIALDPAREDAATHAARALVQQGKLDEAAATLAGRLRSNAAAVQVDVFFDPALRPLWSHPAFAALRPGQPGSAALDGNTLALPGSGVAIAARGGWLATVESTASDGSCSADVRLILRDEATLVRLASTALETWSDDAGRDCEDGRRVPARVRRTIRARVARANQFLREMGFESPAGAERVTFDDHFQQDVTKIRFDAAKLSLVVGKDGVGRLFQGGTQRAEHPVLGTESSARVTWAALLPEQKRILVGRFAFGCEWAELVDVVDFPLP